MRDTDRPEGFGGLGPVKRQEQKPPQPVRAKDGVMRGPDGKLYTDGTAPQPLFPKGRPP